MAVLGISEISNLLITDSIAATDTNTGALRVNGGTSIKGNLYIGGIIRPTTYMNLPIASINNTTLGVTKLYNQKGDQTDGAATPKALNDAYNDLNTKLTDNVDQINETHESDINTLTANIENIKVIPCSWRKSIKTTSEGQASITIPSYNKERMQVMAFINGFTLSDGSNSDLKEYTISDDGVVTTTNSLLANQDFMVIVFYNEIIYNNKLPVANVFYEKETDEVSIVNAIPGVTIKYTTDGSDPNTNGIVYSTPFVISAVTTVKTISSKAGYINSNVGEYTINFIPRVATPVITVVN